MTDHRDYPKHNKDAVMYPQPATRNDPTPLQTTCPSTPICPYTHCRKCHLCPIVNGFGAFGYCAKCIKAPEDYRNEAPLSRNDETPTETKTDD